ncbi:MAG: Ig-like domain-containing protein [Bacteroidota bacterium]|jgi:hypothetical protein
MILRKSGYLLLLSFFFTIVLFLFITGCANIVPPGGGPIDSIPPIMMKAIPKDSARNVTAGKIILHFNEYIELKNTAEQVLISPYPDKQPLIESKLKTITIRFKDSLLPNTTYTIDFGQSIADINEGNIQKDFRFLFSTGSYIDSNFLNGRLMMAETGKTDSTAWALLYKKEEDSTVWKESPAYVARVNSKGYFRFDHLPAGRYYLYGLKDADGNKRYNQPIEAFAFLDQYIDLPADTVAKTLYAFATEKEKKREAAGQSKEKKQSENLSYQNNLQGGALGLLDTLTFSFNEKIAELNNNAVRLYEDTFPDKKQIDIRYDTVLQRFCLLSAFKQGSKYRLIFEKDFVKDSSGRTLKNNDTIRFRVKEEKEYGSLRIRFDKVDLARKPILLFYQNNELKFSFPLNDNEYYTKLFVPGGYSLAMLYDENGNGVWDTGNFFSKPRKQPEMVFAIDKEVVVKENWDNEIEIKGLINTP